MIVLCTFMVVVCAFDYLRRRIPNWLLGLMVTIGILRGCIEQGPVEIFTFTGKMLCVIMAGYALYKIGALGAGDVKLFGVCSGYLPGDKILKFLFFSLLIGAGISLIKILFGKWHMYRADTQMRYNHTICLAGPVFGSILLYMGGVY